MEKIRGKLFRIICKDVVNLSKFPLHAFYLKILNMKYRGGSRKFSRWGGWVISQMLRKYDKKAREAREIFFYPPSLERNLGGGGGGENIHE